jgi:hypothetical protein
MAPNPTATPSPTTQPTNAAVAVAATPLESHPGDSVRASPAPSTSAVDLAAVSLPGGLVVLVIALAALGLGGVALRSRGKP